MLRVEYHVVVGRRLPIASFAVCVDDALSEKTRRTVPHARGT
jgi:hypothetical protein